MITSNIGKIFLDAYNEEYGTNYDARGFFLEQFYPLFFDQNKYMMTAGNSPLENPKLSWDDMIKGKKPYETPEQRKSRFEKLINKIDESEADASIARGYASLDVTATTSGQVTDLKLPNSQEEIYTSWIGDALGIGVQGGFSILFSNKEILLDIFEGWKLYRTSLNEIRLILGMVNGCPIIMIQENMMQICLWRDIVLTIRIRMESSILIPKHGQRFSLVFLKNIEMLKFWATSIA